MDYKENVLTYEEYFYLRNCVGWHNFSENQTKDALNHSVYSVSAVDQNQTIAMGRLIGDGMYFTVVDVVVHPEYQKMGIGGKIIEMILEYINRVTPTDGRSSVQLISEKGKEHFYEKKGFKIIPHEFCGSGMRKVIYKACVADSDERNTGGTKP